LGIARRGDESGVGEKEMKGMMRIAHITVTFPPQRTGTGNVAYHNVVELARRGHDVHVFAPRIDDMPNVPVDETMDGVHVHRIQPLVRYGNASLLPSLFSQVKGFDIAHLHMPFYGGSEAIYLLKRLTNIPLVITHHQDVKLPGVLGIINRLHDYILSRSLFRHADRACFTSLDYARSSQYAPLIERDQLRLGEIPNGVDVDFFTPQRPPEQLIERYDARNRKVLLLVAVLDRAHYFKGVTLLLEAMREMADQSAIAIIVGKGNMKEEYEQYAQTLGIGDRVFFPGFVPDDDLPDYYRLADVTLLPSTTQGEAFGLVLVESLACGTPVIASSLAGVRTVVANNDDGYLVQPGNRNDLIEKIDTMLSLPDDRRQTMGDMGRRKVEKRYAWQQIGTLLETLYTDIQKEQRQTVVERQ
jgi:glycosyltransferase involved in cell wall biosynthesis